MMLFIFHTLLALREHFSEVYTFTLQNCGYTQLWISHKCEGLDEYSDFTIMV